MTDVEKVLGFAEQQCKSEGARLTDKRKQILTALLCSPKAVSAYELVEICKREFGETLPAMSVYRILDFLQEKHLVHKLNLANKYVACAHITCEHDHAVSQFLICNQCQKVNEVSISHSTMSEFQKNVEDAGFRLVSPQLEMSCICDSCIAKES